MLRIALPNKGRLTEDVKGVFADAGLEIRTNGDRALTASLGGEFEAIFVRSQDIPELVSDGVADAGVTGWDLVCETGKPVDVRLDLEFGRCRLVLAAREDAGLERPEQLPPGTRAATVFPRLARSFFAEKGLAVEVVPVSGAAEVAPHQRPQGGLHPARVDGPAHRPAWPRHRTDPRAPRARGCARLGAPGAWQ